MTTEELLGTTSPLTSPLTYHISHTTSHVSYIITTHIHRHTITQFRIYSHILQNLSYTLKYREYTNITLSHEPTYYLDLTHQHTSFSHTNTHLSHTLTNLFLVH